MLPARARIAASRVSLEIDVAASDAPDRTLHYTQFCTAHGKLSGVERGRVRCIKAERRAPARSGIVSSELHR